MDEQPIPASSVEQQLALALRLLAQRPGMNSDVRLTAGNLPADFPLELPLPDGARLVGAMTQTFSRTGPGDRILPITTILVDAPLTGEQCALFYAERLEAAGWEREYFPFGHGGFVHTQPGNISILRFTATTTDYTLTLTVGKGSSEQETSLSIVAQRETQAANERRRERMPHDSSNLIPPLLPPPGASQQGGGGGGGSDHREQHAHVETSLDIAELIAHYDKQLGRAGWRRNDGGVSGPVGWSYWAFDGHEGAPWRGLLLALNALDRPRDYYLLIQIETAERPNWGVGGFSSTTLSAGR